MSTPNETQKIVFDFREEFRIHAAEMKEAIKRLDKVVDAHSDVLWDKDKQPGLATRFDRIEQDRTREKDTRTWWRAAVGVPVVALFIEYLTRLFHAGPKH